MSELEAAGLLETSTGLAALSVLFLLAALYSWWSERRAHRARRRQLLASLEEPSERPELDADEEPTPQERPAEDEATAWQEDAPAAASEAIPAPAGSTEPPGPADAIGPPPPPDATVDEPVCEVEERVCEAEEPVSEAAMPLEPELAEIAAPLERAEQAAEHECARVVLGALGLSADDAEELATNLDREDEPPFREPASPEPRTPGEEVPLDRLDDLIERGELTEARTLLAKLAKHAPHDLRLRGRAGRLALHSGRPDAAVRLLERCVGHAPDALENHLDLCAAHAELGSFEDVVRHARRGLERFPGQAGLLVHLSEAAFELGAPDEALELAADAFRALPRTSSFFHLARLLAMTHRLAESDSSRLRRALDRYPGEPALLHAAGVYEAQYGSQAAALDILRSAASRPQSARHRRAIEREIAALEARKPSAA